MKKHATLRVFVFSLLNIAGFSAGAQTPPSFECSGIAYQIAGPAIGNSSLYSYDITTGSRTLIGELSSKMNAIGYNTQDNYIWGYDMTNHEVVKIGSDASSLSFTIPNLPEYPYNVGDIIGEGYLFLYKTDSARYYVVDVNPDRATYLNLVDPTDGYALDASPYGTAFTGSVPGIKVSDLTYNPGTEMLYGLVDPTGGNAFKIVTLNPATGAVTFAATATTGGGIQTETSAYGSVFTDQNADKLYVFANVLGRFFEVDRLTNTATLLSVSTSALNNDGASCTNAFLTAAITGNVFHDGNGGTVDNSTGGPNPVPDSLYANLISSLGIVVAVSQVNSGGIFGFSDITPGDYTVILSTINGSIGMPAPEANLPSGWMNTGEFNGLPGEGNTLPTDGISDVFTLSAGTAVSNINFGIQQVPTADEKYFLISEASFESTPPAGFPADSGYKYLPLSSDDLTGYTTMGSLSGSDPEDCAVASSCNTATGTTFNINSVSSNTKIYYDFGGALGIMEIVISGEPVSIEDFDVNKLVIYGQLGTGTTGNEVGFSYSITDAAGATSNPVSFQIETSAPLPVSLVSFNAGFQNNEVLLSWLTTEERNSKGFGIERSQNAITWDNIGFVISETNNVTSNGNRHYAYTDKKPGRGVNYYRLKQMDLDGRYIYSTIRQVMCSNYKFLVHPNPANAYVAIEGLSGEETIKLLDITGRIIKDIKAAKTSVIISLDGLNSGLYNINISDINGDLMSARVVKVD